MTPGDTIAFVDEVEMRVKMDDVDQHFITSRRIINSLLNATVIADRIGAYAASVARIIARPLQGLASQ
jgi:hypothetical protein